MDMKCISHSTKNRMKPNTASACMAMSSTAMVLPGWGAKAPGRSDRQTGLGSGTNLGPTLGATSSVSFMLMPRPPDESRRGRGPGAPVTGRHGDPPRPGAAGTGSRRRRRQRFDSHRTDRRSADHRGGRGVVCSNSDYVTSACIQNKSFI